MRIAAVGTTGQIAGPHSQQFLIRAAHEFEGQMLKELLEPLTVDTTAVDGEAGDGGILGGFASEALGKALSEQGGFGIADRVLHQLSGSGNPPGTAAVTRDSHFDTGLRSF